MFHFLKKILAPAATKTSMEVCRYQLHRDKHVMPDSTRISVTKDGRHLYDGYTIYMPADVKQMVNDFDQQLKKEFGNG